MNDLDISWSHMERMIKELASSHVLIQSFIDIELDFVQAELSRLLNVNSMLKSTLKVTTLLLL